ncbi:hypothetical protein V2K65_04800 [Pseudomonas alliivorans]|nr:hypothetical protein [Pseudomonas alliivorans]MEE4652238.1 hypothetical protein [Pseudomonas alliivorans]MEE4729679.1 hypothetical protein [Pseudomonas alliivorans]MEE4746248.1 hypothetical protein [Pseudomonas alliivorans]MEE4897345.1 hypothetical protein [Pseudomonas alliivorans]
MASITERRPARLQSMLSDTRPGTVFAFRQGFTKYFQRHIGESFTPATASVFGVSVERHATQGSQKTVIENRAEKR